MRNISFIFIMSVMLTACSNSTVMSNVKNETEYKESEKVNSDALNESSSSLPSKMPNDFNFSIDFGVGSKNSINTFNSTVQKDLIFNGTVTTRLILTKKEMETIYNEMKGINVFDSKTLILNCERIPFETDIWTIQISGETKTIKWSNCGVTDDAKELLNLRETVFNLIKSKKEFTDLPEAEGGYK